ncbi:unnamed protein product [Mytilus coruscus]|uniref:Uncharacterized protein n=1 Tax=Mytilus coruscus TaxID=42192 RepID=A0A6J8F2F2_MYTCO|nr:unnamed protein product [Mytilus coruscus]
MFLAEVEPRAKFHDFGTGTPSSPVHKLDYAGAIPRRRLIPDMDEYKRVTFQPKPDRVERYDSTSKRLQSPHSPLKRALIPRYESTYLGDQYDTPEVPRAWDAFVTVRDKNKGILQTRVPSPLRPLRFLIKSRIFISVQILAGLLAWLLGGVFVALKDQ